MKEGIIAFVTPEVASIPFTGGLGVFSMCHLRSAKKNNVSMVGFTILPTYGYYDQTIDEKNLAMGIEEFNAHDYTHILNKTDILLDIAVPRPDSAEPKIIKVWVWELPEGAFESSKIYFFDTNIPENDDLSRTNTFHVYGGSVSHGGSVIERKIMQSIILGKATVALIKHLALPVKFYHLNESHVVFTAVELLFDAIKSGMTFEQALKEVRAKVRFTTHTPVEGGNPKYPPQTIERLSFYDTRTLLRIGGNSFEQFDMAATGIFLAGKTNAVSKRHLGKVKEMFHWVKAGGPILSITNGTSQDYWQYPEFAAATTWQEMQTAKQLYLRKLIEYNHGITGIYLSENVLTIAFARRFTGYKRPDLLFRDLDWIKKKLTSNKIQVIYAGKPHPDEYAMVEMWNKIYRWSKTLPNLIILPNYDLEMSKILKAGAHVWLNNPLAPNEACGTSNMSADMNGARRLSTPDGWILESNPENGFIFGSNGISDFDQDVFDAAELRKTIDQRVIPLFYTDKERWSQGALAAKIEAETYWTSDRMLKEYEEKLYI